MEIYSTTTGEVIMEPFRVLLISKTIVHSKGFFCEPHTRKYLKYIGHDIEVAMSKVERTDREYLIAQGDNVYTITKQISQ